MKNKYGVFFAPLATFFILTILSVLVLNSEPGVSLHSKISEALIFSSIPAVAIFLISLLVRFIHKKWPGKLQNGTVSENTKSAFEPFNLMKLFFLSIFIMLAIAAIVGLMGV